MLASPNMTDPSPGMKPADQREKSISRCLWIRLKVETILRWLILSDDHSTVPQNADRWAASMKVRLKFLRIVRENMKIGGPVLITEEDILHHKAA